MPTVLEKLEHWKRLEQRLARQRQLQSKPTLT